MRIDLTVLLVGQQVEAAMRSGAEMSQQAGLASTSTPPPVGGSLKSRARRAPRVVKQEQEQEQDLQD